MESSKGEHAEVYARSSVHQHRQQSHQLTARAVLTQNALGYGWAKSVQSEWLEENLVFLVSFGLTAGDAFQCSAVVRYFHHIGAATKNLARVGHTGEFAKLDTYSQRRWFRARKA